MPKTIRFIELTLENFTNHRNLTVQYKDINKLSGMNGEGKTSIGTAPAWIFWDCDLLGGKFNPSPLNYEFDRVLASLILSVDGTQIKLAREIDEKGKNQFYINDVPTKAKEYDAAVAGLFDKDEFLALYNPSYFFGLHWTKQREMILRYTTAPAKSEVLKHLSDPQATKLDELAKKRSLDDLDKLHRDQKNKLEKQHIAGQSRTKTLQEQLERLDGESIDIGAMRSEVAKINDEIKEIEKVTDSADENNRKINALDTRIKYCLDQRNIKKAKFPALQNEEIQDTCRVCKQPLQGGAIKAAEAEKRERIEQFKAEYDAIITERKELEAERAELEYIDVSEQLTKVRGLEQKAEPLREAIRNHSERERLAKEVENAKKAEQDTLTALKESIFILDSIKAYRGKEAELQAEKVQSLFTTLSIRLFDHIKSSNEYKPAFEIQMDGKNYSALSAGEKIAAGLELSEVLYKQSEMVTPTFIDGIGEYTGKVAVYGQLITGRAVEGQTLKIETEELSNEKESR